MDLGLDAHLLRRLFMSCVLLLCEFCPRFCLNICECGIYLNLGQHSDCQKVRKVCSAKREEEEEVCLLGRWREACYEGWGILPEEEMCLLRRKRRRRNACYG